MSQKGVRFGGRQKGTPNKKTREVREILSKAFNGLADELEQWIRQTGEKQPGKAAELTLTMAEYFVPKLARHEHTGADGAALELRVEINRYVENATCPIVRVNEPAKTEGIARPQDVGGSGEREDTAFGADEMLTPEGD